MTLDDTRKNIVVMASLALTIITQVEPVETEGTPDGTDKSPAKALTIRLVPVSQTTIASDG